MMYDIKQYESWLEGDPRRTYQYLINAIERHIARIREDKHVAAREKYARDFAGGGRPTAPTPTAPAPPDANAKAKAKANAKEKAAPKPKAKSDAAPVLPSPQPKQHAKGKGQGRKGKSKSRSASPRDKKKIPCHFHFIKKSCRKGKDCEYSHDQKTLMLARVVGMVKEVVKHQEDNLQQTRPRRSTSHAGTGQRANVDMATSATSGMMLTCSTLHQIPSLHHRKQPLHFSTTTVMWMSHLS